MSEQWKEIPGYEGLYEASSLGRIRTVPGKTTKNARFPARVWKARILKEKHLSGPARHDARVTLWKDGAREDFLVARIVAAAWIGLPNDGMTVNHINGDWSDNRPDNLEWVTHAQNIQLGFSNGQYDSICKKIVLVDRNGHRFEFRSMAEASRFLSRNPGYVSGALKKGLTVLHDCYGGGYTIASTD